LAAEEAGADCINTFSGARLRANGMGTMSMMWPILDSNKPSKKICRTIQRKIEDNIKIFFFDIIKTPLNFSKKLIL